ncbi:MULTISPECIES: rhodanese-like domain-containing protein [unclassified Roseateles]|uniref:rhodanese-like domain-containing protein n=1 Tax=unclassified Roseateles TaxID=2626991 RepID=UPI0006FBF680|nr:MULTISPECIES: rhodanese-like domain-containing protein [unclassified Roseateles]KQW51815.1 sulfurtransferase [Pelomonas sp. Root405]KRA78048.1 sulfurtransferase [Pelomonas sp. Root662]
MNFLIENWFLIVAALVSGGLLIWPLVVSGSQGAAVAPAEAVQLINREKGVLIDVSEPEEFAKGHAVGARNIPFGQIEGHKSLPSNKSLPLVLVCPTGARAGRAAGMLRKLGYEKARVLAGGLRAWREASLPVEKSA